MNGMLHTAAREDSRRSAPPRISARSATLSARSTLLTPSLIFDGELISGDSARRVFIDCGKCGGLSPGVIAGPTCTSADILFERTPAGRSTDLGAGDRRQILTGGACTFTYSSVGFNGFGLLRTVFLESA